MRPLLTEAERRHYLEGWRKRAREGEAARERARDLALAKARQAARVAREKYGIRRTVLFGSLAARAFDEDSDVDLCVEGIESEGLYYSLHADLERELLPLRLHLVLWEDLDRNPPGRELRQEIEARGVDLG